MFVSRSVKRKPFPEENNKKTNRRGKEKVKARIVLKLCT
jgi:hypothetical protein